MCTKLTRALACSAASGDEPGARRRDYYFVPRLKLTVTLVSASYYPDSRVLKNLDMINRLMIKEPSRG